MIDRSHLFRLAWRKAHIAAVASGRRLRAVFPEALRQAWATLRDARSIESVMAREFGAIITEVRAQKAAGTFRLGMSRGWRFANAGV